MNKEIIVSCSEDDRFQQDRRITHSCNRTFALDESNIFYVEALGYFDDIIGEYYTICPHCGYIVLLDENSLSNELRFNAQGSYREDHYQYHKNSLRSQLIHPESMTPKRSAKARVKALY